MQYKQNGSALAVSLVLLTAITLISISSMQRSGLQTKIVSNLQHHEQLFQTTRNEQEYWWKQLQSGQKRGDLITQALNQSTLNSLNQKSYSPIDLEDNSGFNKGGSSLIIPTTQMLVMPPEKGEIALAEGSEVGSIVPQKIKIFSRSDGGRPTLIANQLTGITAYLLNVTKNSL